MSPSTLKRDSSKVMHQMKKTKQPIVQTGNGKAAVVVEGADYQKLIELQERSQVVEILRQRLASGSRKKGRPAEDFFNEFFARNVIG